ncbi:MAG: YolD-like family protein [Clostridia bacterium]|nr:YolD-like family protein [Clostridia bacterium]
MANRPRHKMPVSERAKQFAPFSAVKGLTEALQRAEKIYQPMAELAPEREYELNIILSSMGNGCKANITYFHDGEYLQKSGEIEAIDEVNRVIRMRGNYIEIDYIVDIEIMQ